VVRCFLGSYSVVVWVGSLVDHYIGWKFDEDVDLVANEVLTVLKVI
jgi:hypothetical protein